MEYPKVYSSSKQTIASTGKVRWRSVWAIKENGKILKKQGSTFLTKKEADQDAIKNVESLKFKNTNSLVDEDQEMTVGEFAETHWINNERQQKVVNKNKITRAINFWKEIGLWDIKICELTTQMMFKYVSALKDKGLAVATIQNYKTELNTLLRLAVVMGQTDRNVMDGVKSERRTQEKQDEAERIFEDVQSNTWTLEEIYENLEKLRNLPKIKIWIKPTPTYDHPQGARSRKGHWVERSASGSVPEILWYARFLIGLFLGLRSGEIMALKHSSFDYKNKTVKIDRSMGRREKLNNKTLKVEAYSYEETKVKSSSQRIQKVQDEVFDLIKEIAVMQDMWGTYHKDQYIFTDKKGTMLNAYYFRGNWLRVQELCGIEKPLPTPKHTRHTSATVLAGLGWSSTDIANHLGHKNDRVTREYYIQESDQIKKSMADEFSKDQS